MSKRQSKKETLENYKKMPGIYFVGDKSQKIYHEYNCKAIRHIAKDNLFPCGPFPESQKYRPCPYCKPVHPEVMPSKDKGRGRRKSKAELMREAMFALAERRGMHLTFVGDNALVTTIAGEWFFDINNRPIQLHHKNIEKWTDSHGNLKGYYHKQNVQFETPLLALAYIYRHERAAENLAFVDSEEKSSVPAPRKHQAIAEQGMKTVPDCELWNDDDDLYANYMDTNDTPEFDFDSDELLPTVSGEIPLWDCGVSEEDIQALLAASVVH